MAKRRSILVVEDEETLLETLRYNLEREGYAVLLAKTGGEALERAREGQPDLVLLDIMLPELDGFSVCRALRQESTVPILMLTAKREEVDRVVGLELGADDYVTKPFSLRELLARVRALLRRVEMEQQRARSTPEGEKLRVGDLEVDIARHEVLLQGEPVQLKPKEFDLLSFLLRNRGRVFTREQLLEQVWGYDYPGGSRTVDVHVRWLREKLEREPSSPQFVQTVRGVGYKFQG